MGNPAYTELPDDFKVDEKFAKIIDPAGPAPVKMMAAKGIVPGAGPADTLHVLYALTFDPAEPVATGAAKALAETPPNILTGAINEKTHPAVIDFLARHHIEDEVLMEFFVLKKQVHSDTLYHVAETCPSLKIIEIIAKNQERLLTAPRILTALKANPVSPKSLIDVTTAFLQMAGVLPMGAEARSAGLPDRIDDDMVDALLEDEDFDDSLTLDTESDHVTEAQEEEAQKKLTDMTVSERIKLAWKANKAVRSILIRDTNKMVIAAVLNSGRITEGEAISFTKNRTIDSEVLKHIYDDRDLRKRYEVKVNLANNPKTPQGIAIRILRELRVSDLKQLAKNRNIPGTVAQQAKRLADQKSGGGRR